MRIRATVGLVVAAAVLLVTLPTAAAMAASPLIAAPSMLRKTDLTRALGVERPRGRYVETPGSSNPPLCNQVQQNLVSGPAAQSAISVSVLHGSRSGVVQVMYEYGSPEAAAAAFRAMERRARNQCNQRNALPALGPGREQLLSAGTAPVAFDGVAGLWTREIDGLPTVQGTSYDSYSLTLLVGSALQQLTLTDDVRTSDVQRSATDTLALTLADRWTS